MAKIPRPGEWVKANLEYQEPMIVTAEYALQLPAHPTQIRQFLAEIARRPEVFEEMKKVAEEGVGMDGHDEATCDICQRYKREIDEVLLDIDIADRADDPELVKVLEDRRRGIFHAWTEHKASPDQIGQEM